jgi:DNA-binding transcriptional MerR regulator
VLGTTGADCRPYLIGVGARWYDGDIYFLSGPTTRKARNLAANSACSIAMHLGELHSCSTAKPTRPAIQAVGGLVRQSGLPVELTAEGFTAPFGPPNAGPPWTLYRFVSHTAIAQGEPGSTRWRLSFRSLREQHLQVTCRPEAFRPKSRLDPDVGSGFIVIPDGHVSPFGRRQEMTQLRIGELATATGLTVRTLRHYDQIGLLQPRMRTGSGYRIYGDAEVRRLQQIRSLQALGFSLEQIGTMLDGNEASLPEVIGWQLASVDRELAALQRLRARLHAVSEELQGSQRFDIDSLTALMKEMTMVEQYYTEEQLETLAARRAAYGDEQIRAFEQQWADLIARAEQAKADDLDPISEPVLEIAREWSGLVQAFTGGDAGIEQSVERVWQEEDEVHGFDAAGMRDLMSWLAPAMEKIAAGG